MSDLPALVKIYQGSLQRIHDYFGYVEDWVRIPLDFRLEMYWALHQNEDGTGEVAYCEKKDQVENLSGDQYQDAIYTQHFLPKWVYEAEEYTLICVNPRVDGNRYLAIYDNTKRVPWNAEQAEYWEDLVRE